VSRVPKATSQWVRDEYGKCTEAEELQAGTGWQKQRGCAMVDVLENDLCSGCMNTSRRDAVTRQCSDLSGEVRFGTLVW